MCLSVFIFLMLYLYFMYLDEKNFYLNLYYICIIILYLYFNIFKII